MRLHLRVNGLPHCPRNRSHAIIKKGKSAFLGKTEAAHSYERALKHHLSIFRAEAESFKANFDKDLHCLTAQWLFVSPEVKTASGRYSETGVDLDAHKVLQDTVMGFVGINDAYIVSDTRTKAQGPYSVYVVLTIQNIASGEELL